MKTFKRLHQSTISTAFGLIVLMTLTFCKKNVGTVNVKSAKIYGTTSREGGVTLLITDDDLIQVNSNPKYSTAEWNFNVKAPEHYDVWLSSPTSDTSHFRYKEKDTITTGDARFEKKPMGDEIVISDPSVKEHWYRAESHMGSVFLRKQGEYQVQVISDSEMSHSSYPSGLSPDKHTLIKSLIIKLVVIFQISNY